MESTAKHLMIVARPGDESLYGGSLFVTEDNITVICLTGGDDEKARTSFRQAMKYWEIDDIHIWDFNYHDPASFPQGSQVIDEHLAYAQDILSPAYLKLHNFLQERPDSYTSVITHQDDGYFYHAFNIAVHNLVRDLLSHRKGGGYAMCEECESLYVFDYDQNTKINTDIVYGKLQALDRYDRPDIWDVKNERLRYLTNERVRPFECR